MRCKGDENESTRRFDGCFRVKFETQLSNGEATFVVAVARSSSAAPQAWKCGQEFLKDGIKLFANSVLDSFANDHSSGNDISGTFVALYDVHTKCVPTGKHTQAHTTTDPSSRLYMSRAYKFTHAIDEELEAFAARDIKPLLLSIGLDGFACRTDLVLAWLKRSPAFTLVIRETELVHDMDEAYFPRSSSGLHYGFFDSSDLEKSLSADMAVDDAIENLIEAWNACQAWKDGSPANNGRLIGRNGNHERILKKSKRGPDRALAPPTDTAISAALKKN